MKKALSFLIFLTAAQLGFAQSAYRCEVDGRTVYQATDCPGGKPVTGQARAEADREKMLERKRRDEAELRKAESERRVRQAEIDRQMVGASAIKPVAAPAAPPLSLVSPDGKKGNKGGKAKGRKGVDPALFGAPAASPKKPSKPKKPSQNASLR